MRGEAGVRTKEEEGCGSFHYSPQPDNRENSDLVGGALWTGFHQEASGFPNLLMKASLYGRTHRRACFPWEKQIIIGVGSPLYAFAIKMCDQEE